MTVVDSSFLVALQDEDDLFHEEATRRPLWGDRFLVPREIWVEYCQYLMRARPAPERAAALNSLREGVFDVQSVLEPTELATLAADSDDVQTRLQDLGHRPLTLYDLVVLHIASRFGEKVYTFDKAMVAAIQEGLFPGAHLG